MRRAMPLLVLAAALGAVRPGTSAQPPAVAWSAPVPMKDLVTRARDYARAHKDAAPYLRFLSVAHVLDPQKRARLLTVATLGLNMLSSEPLLFDAVEVCECLYAVDLRAMDRNNPDRLVKVWEDLARVNPLFVVGVDVHDATTAPEPKKDEPRPAAPPRERRILGYKQEYDPYWGTIRVPVYADDPAPPAPEPKKDEPGPAGKAVRKFLPAAGAHVVGGRSYPLPLPEKETAELVALTGSVTPIVPADLWYDETQLQEDQREGHGYYDWFGFKSPEDVERFAGFDRKAVQARGQEVFAVQRFSGVANNNRQTFAFPVPDGFYWETHDCLFSEDLFDAKTQRVTRKDAFGNYFEDLEHDAEEVVFPLRNGLPGGSAHQVVRDAAGKVVKRALVKSVPGNVASTTASVSRDRRIHVAYSCWECHDRHGLKAFRCDLRALRDPLAGLTVGALAANDPAYRRIAYGATGPIYEQFARAEAAYGAAVESCCGVTWETAVRYAREVRAEYLYRPVDVRRVAAEFGWEPVPFVARLTEYRDYKFAGRQVVDPVVATLLTPFGAVRREQLRGRTVLIWTILGGANP